MRGYKAAGPSTSVSVLNDQNTANLSPQELEKVLNRQVSLVQDRDLLNYAREINHAVSTFLARHDVWGWMKRTTPHLLERSAPSTGVEATPNRGRSFDHIKACAKHGGATLGMGRGVKQLSLAFLPLFARLAV
jgi:hypothetical protein